MSVIHTFIDPDGEYVDLSTGDLVITVQTDEIERIYNQLRAAQLGADSRGNL